MQPETVAVIVTWSVCVTLGVTYLAVRCASLQGFCEFLKKQQETMQKKSDNDGACIEALEDDLDKHKRRFKTDIATLQRHVNCVDTYSHTEEEIEGRRG